jgi:hypothetical protein
MLEAYVGIVSQRGIELLCPEHPTTIRFLWRRVQREPERIACFWMVAPVEGARIVQTAVCAHYPQVAWQLLLQRAHDYGCLVPDHEETLPVFRQGSL